VSETTTGVTITVAEMQISGMHCGSCVALIEETLGDEPAVAGAQVDLDTGRASVRFDPAVTSLASLCTVVTELGYPASPAGPAPPAGAG
jgi:copper chaperone CopZ